MFFLAVLRRSQRNHHLICLTFLQKRLLLSSLKIKEELPKIPAVTLVELNNLTRKGVEKLLGSPDLYREEADAQVLLYSQRACALHLFLFPPNPGAVPVVKYTETIPSKAETESDKICFLKLLARMSE